MRLRPVEEVILEALEDLRRENISVSMDLDGLLKQRRQRLLEGVVDLWNSGYRFYSDAEYKAPYRIAIGVVLATLLIVPILVGQILPRLWYTLLFGKSWGTGDERNKAPGPLTSG